MVYNIPYTVVEIIVKYLPLTTQIGFSCRTKSYAEYIASKRIAKWFKRCIYAFKIGVGNYLIHSSIVTDISVLKSILVNSIVQDITDDIFMSDEFVRIPDNFIKYMDNAQIQKEIRQCVNYFINDRRLNYMVICGMYTCVFANDGGVELDQGIEIAKQYVRARIEHSDTTMVEYAVLTTVRDLVLANVSNVRALCIDRIGKWNMINIGMLYFCHYGDILTATV